jgi:CRISPR system Cascade subunit CasB
MNEPKNDRLDRETKFIQTIAVKCQTDKGFAAKMRRADNPSTEHQCWDFLAAFGIDLEKENERLAFALIAAAVARSKIETNGTRRLGKALLDRYDGDKDGQGKARLRRLLACEDVEELCRILRPILSLVLDKGKTELDHARLLRQISRFARDPQRIKAQWAQEYYGAPALSTEKTT